MLLRGQARRAKMTSPGGKLSKQRVTYLSTNIYKDPGSTLQPGHTLNKVVPRINLRKKRQMSMPMMK
jgi:hypothetical protein